VRDDDRPGEFRFTTNRYEVWEDGTPVHEIIIERLNGASGTVTLVVTPGEVRLGARRNVDFVAAPLNVTFAPGHLQHRVRIPIIEDALAEPAENLNLNLSLAQGAPPGATLGTLRSATLVIRDNDAIARPKFRPAATSDSGRVQFRVEADPSFRFAVETSTDLRQWSRLGLYELDADQKLPALAPPQGAGPGLFYRVVQLSD
jgi:hypothetical protein